jgi:hypothetical protein
MMARQTWNPGTWECSPGGCRYVSRMCWQSMHHHRFRAGCWSFVPLPLHHTHLTAIVQCPRRELNLPAQNESPLKRAPAPFRVLEFSARSFMAGWASSTFLQICYQMGIRCLPVQLLPIPSAFRSSGFPILAANNGASVSRWRIRKGKEGIRITRGDIFWDLLIRCERFAPGQRPWVWFFMDDTSDGSLSVPLRCIGCPHDIHVPCSGESQCSSESDNANSNRTPP